MPQHVPSPPSAPLAHSSTKKSPFRRSHPLTTNPELEVLSYDLSSESTVHEYRVCSFRTLRTGRRVQRGGSVALDGLIVALLAVAWRYGAGKALTALSWTDGSLADVALSLVFILLLAMWIFVKLRVILNESVLPLPQLGLQLSTTRGLQLPYVTPIPLSTSRRFIPLDKISTVVINEGLRRWGVIYYLGVILKEGEGILVALEEVRPAHAVLQEVYHSVRETLFDDYASDGEKSEI